MKSQKPTREQELEKGCGRRYDKSKLSNALLLKKHYIKICGVAGLCPECRKGTSKEKKGK